MVRWKYCLVLAMLLLMRTDAKGAEDEDDEDVRHMRILQSKQAHPRDLLRPYLPPGTRAHISTDCHRGEESDEEEDDEEDEEDDDRPDAMEIPPGRRMQVAVTPLAAPTPSRTTKKAPLECYVCGYRSEMPLRSCLDPTKYRVHSVTCHNLEDKCFTTVISKEKSYVAVIRGCRTGCVGSPDTTCCERNRCNNQAFAMPIVPRTQEVGGASLASVATKTTPSNVLFFVTVLLLLQTVVKVAFV